MDGETLLNLRTKFNMKQRDFGVLLGFAEKSAKQTIHDMEQGRRGRRIPPHLYPLVIMLETHGKESLTDFLKRRLEEASPEPNHPTMNGTEKGNDSADNENAEGL